MNEQQKPSSVLRTWQFKIKRWLGNIMHKIQKFWFEYPGDPNTAWLNSTSFQESIEEYFQIWKIYWTLLDLKDIHMLNFGNIIFHTKKEEDKKILKIAKKARTIFHRNSWKALCTFLSSSKYLKETWTILDGSSPPATGHELSTARHHLRTMIVINCGINS